MKQITPNGICYEFVDPRNGEVFYVGIGEPSRVFEPERNEAVNERIAQIRDAGFEESRNIVFEMSMEQCLIWEHREIAIRGLVKDGGTLLNISKGTTKCAPKHKSFVNSPAVAIAKAIAGRRLIEEAIEALLEANPKGLCNASISKTLSLEFAGKDGRHKGYVTYSILHQWVREGRVIKNDAKLFFKKLT